ncbi:MAG: rhomboid family intramembrane serine protease [Flavobacteriaceae bacterium]|jgi:membrane associated rhomboid family serine protease|nr:rhomboid family intramembrane serine protease [Flavobacteriaceae bacterium]
MKRLFQDKLNYKAIFYPLLMLFAMWLGFLFQFYGFFENCAGSIIPLTPEGLKGIIFSPFLHGDLGHIFGNSVPIFALMFLLFQFYPKVAGKVFLLSWFLSGFAVWLLPPLIDIFTGSHQNICIIGASGIVYALAFFLFFSGIFRWNTKLIGISLVVALYYGSLIWGVLPQEWFSDEEEAHLISWQSHLAGAVIGIISAFIFRKQGEKKKKFIWEFPNYYSEKDDKLWQNYIQKHPEDFNEIPYEKENIWKYLDELRKAKIK